MGKAISVEDRLDRLAALRAEPAAAHVREELVKRLAEKSNLVVAKAAALVGEFRRDDLASELVAAFERFIGQPGLDKGCAATTAAAKALVDTDERGDADGARRVFVAGARHVQREPVWGGSADVAAELRGACALGLAKTGYPQVMVVLADLLADPEPQARAGAARALGYTGQEAAAVLLRFKLAGGDRTPDVTGECLSALVRLGPPWAVAFVARFLDDPEPGIRTAAALALGESRKAEALDALRPRIGRETDEQVRRPLMLAVAMLRTPESREVLVGVIRMAKPPDAAAAVEAMGIYRHDPAVRAQIQDAVDARNDPGLARMFRATFTS